MTDILAQLLNAFYYLRNVSFIVRERGWHGANWKILVMSFLCVWGVGRGWDRKSIKLEAGKGGHLQSNFIGSNTFGTMKISSRQG